MKYSRPLDDLLGQKSKVKILRHLANTRLEMSGRQVAADIGMSPWACHRALQDLTDQGVLVMRNIGRAHLFRLNEESYVVILSLALEMCFRLLSSEMHERFDRVNERFDDMHHQMLVQTRWLIGSLALIGDGCRLSAWSACYWPSHSSRRDG